jgi:hypothetical protein
MKKIDILNFITDFRKAPNQPKRYSEILENVAKGDELALHLLLTELQQNKVIKETMLEGQKAFQVISR